MILIIKHGALGDIIQATEAFRCIREKHIGQKIVLMTKQSFVGFAKEMPFFDDVIVDYYPKINPIQYYKTLKQIARYDKIYDLQHSGRTARYFNLLKFFNKLPLLSTIPKQCDRKISAFKIFKEQLQDLNYRDYPCLDFMKSDIEKFNLPQNFALIVAGCSLRGEAKKWTPEGFANECTLFFERGITPVFIGSMIDKQTIDDIKKLYKHDYIDLSGQTNLNDIASIARKATECISIDTGPAHIIAGVGCKIKIIFNIKYSNPEKSLAVGKFVKVFMI